MIASASPGALPAEGVAALDEGRSSDRAPTTSLPPDDGAAPLDTASSRVAPGDGAISPDVATPLEDGTSSPPDSRAWVVAPLGDGPALAGPKPPDPRTLHIARVDLLVGAVWRIKQTEAILTTSVEVGRMHGFSGTFHASMIIAPDRNFVKAFDFPIGVGALARGRLRNRPLFGSVGLSAGILVHRGAASSGVTHRVDPDFRLPIRFAWTPAIAGFSLAIVQGYSVRTRTYESRGVEVWRRHPYRIAFVLGLHLDFSVKRRAKGRRSAREKGKS